MVVCSEERAVEKLSVAKVEVVEERSVERVVCREVRRVVCDETGSETGVVASETEEDRDRGGEVWVAKSRWKSSVGSESTDEVSERSSSGFGL